MAKKESKTSKKGLSYSIMGVIAVLVVGIAVLASQMLAKNQAVEEQRTAPTEQQPYIDQASGPFASGTHHAIIHVKGYGDIYVELNANVAPITVSNFVKLAQDGFYNGLTFHRIIKGFMIQGGDPQGNGTGGSDKNIKGEFSANKVTNPLPHTRGTISMARSQDMNSASSQFFIVHEDSPHLNGQYAAFGQVTQGMDVVDAICNKVKTSGDGKVEGQPPVIESIEIVD